MYKREKKSIIGGFCDAGEYNIEVEAVPAKHYDHHFHAPRNDTKAGGHVTLLDSEGQEIPEKGVLLLAKDIRGGRHDLQALAEYVNQKIEKLVERYGNAVVGVPEVSHDQQPLSEIQPQNIVCV